MSGITGNSDDALPPVVITSYDDGKKISIGLEVSYIQTRLKEGTIGLPLFTELRKEITALLPNIAPHPSTTLKADHRNPEFRRQKFENASRLGRTELKQVNIILTGAGGDSDREYAAPSTLGKPYEALVISGVPKELEAQVQQLLTDKFKTLVKPSTQASVKAPLPQPPRPVERRQAAPQSQGPTNYPNPADIAYFDPAAGEKVGKFEVKYNKADRETLLADGEKALRALFIEIQEYSPGASLKQGNIKKEVDGSLTLTFENILDEKKEKILGFLLQLQQPSAKAPMAPAAAQVKPLAPGARQEITHVKIAYFDPDSAKSEKFGKCEVTYNKADSAMLLGNNERALGLFLGEIQKISSGVSLPKSNVKKNTDGSLTLTFEGIPLADKSNVYVFLLNPKIPLPTQTSMTPAFKAATTTQKAAAVAPKAATAAPQASTIVSEEAATVKPSVKDRIRALQEKPGNTPAPGAVHKGPNKF